MTDYSISPRDRWLVLHPGKTPEDWGTLVKDGLRKKELVELDGRIYLSEAKKKRRQNERQRLCRKRRKEHIDALERENAKLRELASDMWRFTGAACGKYPRLFDPAPQGGQTVSLNALDAFEQRMRELGIEVDG